MDYKYKQCPICGSTDIKIICEVDTGDDSYYEYKCDSCDSTFSSKKLLKKEPLGLNSSVIDGLLDELAEVKSSLARKNVNPKDIYDENIKYVFEVCCVFEDETGSSGTGIVISSRYLLTNAHVVRSNDKKLKKCFGLSYNKEKINLEVVAFDKDLDIAILKADCVFGGHIAYSEEPISTGEVCFTIGNSKGEGLSFLNGVIADNHREIDGQDYIMFTAPITGGNSGGPLINSKGAMVGMTTLSTKGESAMNYAIPNETITKFLKDM